MFLKLQSRHLRRTEDPLALSTLQNKKSKTEISVIILRLQTHLKCFLSYFFPNCPQVFKEDQQTITINYQYLETWMMTLRIWNRYIWFADFNVVGARILQLYDVCALKWML